MQGIKYPIISAVFDYVVELKGEYDYKLNQIFSFRNNLNEEIKLMLVSASHNSAYCLSNGDINELNVGVEVKPTSNNDTITTKKSYFGSIIDIHGEIVYPKVNTNDIYEYKHKSKIFNIPNQLLEYKPLDKQLHTGYMSIDLLIPIGLGQRELIIGDSKTGKTHLALNTIINQKNRNVKCIYVAIGQKQSQLADVYQTLKENDALNNTIIITASSSSPYDQFLAPYVGMAHAENIAKEEDVLIVFDSLTNHANIYRELALLTNKPVGKEAYPGDMFYIHSRLLERSGKFADSHSITALPILQTVEGDITSLIASNIISITDGQIVTSSQLFAEGK
ncbi:UNVERIFIED_CONTAM: ATP F0F1 synthase subunit alpha [Campylobacter lari]